MTITKEQDQLTHLKKLAIRSGGCSKALQLIKSVKGYCPTHSALNKCLRGETKPSAYTMQSYIEDLTKALEIRDND